MATETTTLRSISASSAARIGLILYGGIGLIAGAFIALASLVGGMAGMNDSAGGPFTGLFMGVGAIIFVPLFYGVMGAVFAALGALIYNLAASWVGGLQFELSTTPTARSAEGPGQPPLA